MHEKVAGQKALFEPALEKVGGGGSIDPLTPCFRGLSTSHYVRICAFPRQHTRTDRIRREQSDRTASLRTACERPFSRRELHRTDREWQGKREKESQRVRSPISPNIRVYESKLERP